MIIPFFVYDTLVTSYALFDLIIKFPSGDNREPDLYQKKLINATEAKVRLQNTFNFEIL